MKQKNKAFTLIELLIVIAIIGILATIIIIRVSGASVKARDTVRKRDVNQISKALEMYYLDMGHYPVNPGDPNTTNDISGSPSLVDWAWLNNILEPNYLGDLPKDPKNNYWSGYFYNYSYQNDAEIKDFYVILANKLENTSDPDTCGTSGVPKRTFIVAFMGGPYLCTNESARKDNYGISNK